MGIPPRWTAIGQPTARWQIHLVSVLFHSLLRVCDVPLSGADFGLPVRSGGRGARRTSRPLLPRRTAPPPPPGDGDPPLLPWLRPPEPMAEDRVHTFNAEEIRALYLACSTLFERVLLTTLFVPCSAG